MIAQNSIGAGFRAIREKKRAPENRRPSIAAKGEVPPDLPGPITPDSVRLGSRCGLPGCQGER
jgi:hypothetical protein